MEMRENVLLFCDTEEEYAELFGDYLRTRKDIPWEVKIYTNVEELLQKEQKNSAVMLVAAENAYCEDMKALHPGQLVILNESGVIRCNSFKHVNKYQQANRVVRDLLEIYMEDNVIQFPRLAGDFGTKFIGMYSPVRRCMQTGFALSMSQLLARKHSTLYLNFEHYAGITELLPDRQTRDLADLLYFLTAEEEKFRLRIQTMIQHKGSLHYVPPMRMGQNLLTITATEWLQLLQRIGEFGEYEYVVLDLSESMQGLFDILRMCTKVFTLTQNDKVSQAKLLQYEQLLSFCDYGDILEKTKRCSLPTIRKLPEELEQYTRGELAEFVKREVRELCGG